MPKRILVASLGLAVAWGPGVAQDSEPWHAERPIARDTPAFRAPADPPREGEAPEPVPVVEPEGPIALEDALALALMGNPELAMFAWDTRADEARVLQADKIPNPELDLRLYRLGIPRASARPDEARWRVVFSQVFELGGKRRHRRGLAQSELDIAAWNYEVKRVDVATEVVGEFVGVLGAQRRAESLRRSLDYFEEMRDRVEALVETGAMRALEAHQARRQVGLARIESQRAESELMAARFRLAATWGSTAPRFTEAVGDLGQVRPVPPIETVFEVARQSPALARRDAEIARGEAALALAKAERVPDLTAGAGVRWQEHAPEEDYLVDVEIDLPFFDRKQGDIRAARHEIARARAARKAAEAASSETIAELYYRLIEAEARASTLENEVVPAARAAFEAYRQGLESAFTNLGDLLDARRDLARAEVSHTEALVDFHRTLAALEGVVGASLTD